MTLAIPKLMLGLGAALGLAGALAGCDSAKGEGTDLAMSEAMCPNRMGWSEGLPDFLAADAAMDTDTPANDDCSMHEWSWETFVWVMAPDDAGTPRFLSWKTPADLTATGATRTGGKPGMLRLDAHMKPIHLSSVSGDTAGAITEADGSMLIGPNGYPVYASVHMTDGFFQTVSDNLIANGKYESNPDQDSYFSVGDAVVKATWYRLDEGETAPDGAYTTQAQVPVLKEACDEDACVATTTGQFTTATVALVGMHVVGNTDNHPEFVWATFEHKLNAPQFADNTFVYNAGKSDPSTYTFYKGGTPFGTDTLLVNTNPGDGPVVSFDATTGKFSPATQVVQMNKTGGENQPDGSSNIDQVNLASQQEMESHNPGLLLQNYNLIGTVWMEANSYVTTNPNWSSLGMGDAIGSVSLMNSTAETFLQSVEGKPGNNCFMCHNAGSFSFDGMKEPKLTKRRVAITHMIAFGSPYAAANDLPVTSGGDD